jgi:hypothetical protein
MGRHLVLQAKTLTFLDNNVEGHNFVRGWTGTHIDRADLRLKYRVRHRLQELEELKGSLPYAQVPDGFWRSRAKILITEIVRNPFRIVDTIAKALKNPFGAQ